MRYIFLTFSLFLTFCLFFASKSNFPHGKTIKTIVIDAGHGGQDPGAVANGIKEKDICLKIALALKKKISQEMPNLKVVLTRDTDKFIELHRRGEIAQANKADFFISIHCNSTPKTPSNAKGTEIYILGTNQGQERYRAMIRENQSVLFEKNYADFYGGFDPKSPEGEIFQVLLKDEFRKESLSLASKIDKYLVAHFERITKGVKQAPFIVLWRSAMPALLVETGFVTNPTEAAWLNSQKGQNEIVDAIFYSLKSYNEGEKIPNLAARGIEKKPIKVENKPSPKPQIPTNYTAKQPNKVVTSVPKKPAPKPQNSPKQNKPSAVSPTQKAVTKPQTKPKTASPDLPTKKVVPKK